MSVLIINDEAKKEIAKVIQYAQKNPVTKTMIEKGFTVGDNAQYVCYLQTKYRCAFSFELQPCGWCRHLSVSVDNPGKLPAIPAVELIMEEFGFEGDIHNQIHVWMEPPEDPYAVNVLGLIDTKNKEQMELLKCLNLT